MDALPVIDVAPLVRGDDDCTHVAAAIDHACREAGFFYIAGHGVPDDLQRRLDVVARQLFALPEQEKAEVSMQRGGRAWRGWFPLEGELTSGRPDRKEGFYAGAELPADHPRVRAGTPLHGPNLFPRQLPELRTVLLAYLDELTRLGHALVAGLGLALGLDRGWFHRTLTADPLVLFRIFRYPPSAAAAAAAVAEEADTWGVGEHTDYGLLTILRQDDVGGLEVHAPGGWISAPPIPGTFVCNLGDMLERMTDGRYRSTPHRVRNTGGTDRFSFPFFFDPGWDAEVVPVPVLPGEPLPEGRPRWDGADLGAVQGTYGDYVLGKVAKVFPALGARVLGG